jgi:hypothetical protein
LKGKLVSVSGIGGETTGYGIDLGLKQNGDGTFRHEVIEIVPGDFKDKIDKLINSDTEVELTGYHATVKGGVERPTIKAFKVTDLKGGKLDKETPKKDSTKKPEDADEGRITRKAPPKENVVEIGLNGVLKWKKHKDDEEFLALEGPSGAVYPLGVADAALTKKLKSIAEDDKNHIELFGDLKLKGGKVVEFNPREIESSNSQSRGKFIVGLKKGLSDRELKDIANTFELLPATKVTGASNNDTLTLTTDLSEKSFKKRTGR